MQITLDPRGDSAALSALYVYAALTMDEKLSEWLDYWGRPGEYETLTRSAVESIDESGRSIVGALERVGLEPVRLVCRHKKTDEHRDFNIKGKEIKGGVDDTNNTG